MKKLKKIDPVYLHPSSGLAAYGETRILQDKLNEAIETINTLVQVINIMKNDKIKKTRTKEG